MIHPVYFDSDILGIPSINNDCQPSVTETDVAYESRLGRSPLEKSSFRDGNRLGFPMDPGITPKWALLKT